MESMTSKFYPLPNGVELWYYIQSEVKFRPHLKITRSNQKYSPTGRGTEKFLSVSLTETPKIIYAKLKISLAEKIFLLTFVKENFKVFSDYLSPSEGCNFDAFYTQSKGLKWPTL